MRNSAAAAAVVVLACVSWSPIPLAQNSLPLSATEISSIVALGPWPLPQRRDPSNRVSGNPEAVHLGEQLFFSPRLSGTGGVLCASCHETWRRFADGRAKALGIEPVDRNTQSLINVRLQRWFGWDGANDSLWAQSIRPLLDAREMRSSAAHVGNLMRGDPALSTHYRAAFGTPPPANDEALLADAGKALAAYLETLESGRTPFDDYRDALARKDLRAAAAYPGPALRGLRIFVGRGGCARCHAGPNFSDGMFHAVGVNSVTANGMADAGRRSGIRKLLASPYNLLGPYNDDPARTSVAGTRAAAAEQRTAGAFRTPSLRDVALTPPYMHDGSMATLCEVVRGHPVPGRSGGADASYASETKLTAAETLDVLEFLRTLTAKDAAGTGAAEQAPPC